MASDDIDFDKLTRAELKKLTLPIRAHVAQLAAGHWQSISPVRTGAYRDSIKAKQNGDRVWVVAEDPGAAAIEYGTKNTPEHGLRAKTEEYFNNLDMTFEI